MGNTKEGSGGKFRAKKTYFSMVSNNALRDPELSLRAKGLYSLIQSYITLEGFTLYKNFLMTQSKDSHNTFDLAWKELKQKGYLVQYRINGENGRINYEYELLDIPEIPQPKNQGVVNQNPPQPKKPFVVKPPYGKTTNGDVGSINNTELNNTNWNNNQIISEEEVMDMIGYDPICGNEIVENIVTIIAEVLNTPDSDSIRVNKTDMSAKVVKERFRKIEYKHLDYITLVLNEFTGDIRNIKSFMITTIYNAVATCDVYFTTRVNRDLYEMKKP